MYDVIVNCTAREPEDRPPFSALVARLKPRLQESLQELPSTYVSVEEISAAQQEPNLDDGNMHENGHQSNGAYFEVDKLMKHSEEENNDEHDTSFDDDVSSV